MKKSTKFILVLTTFVIIFALSVSATQAIDLTNKLTQLAPHAGYGDGTPDLATTIGKIIQGFLALVGMVFMIYIIYGGYIWIMAKGNEEQLTKAKSVIRGSIWGIIIILAAYAISAFVVSQLSDATGYGATPEPDGSTSVCCSYIAGCADFNTVEECLDAGGFPTIDSTCVGGLCTY